MKTLIGCLFGILLQGCGSLPGPASSATGSGEPDSSYSQLSSFISTASTSDMDSIRVLIIPIDAACNSCRDKSIDMLNRHKDSLHNRFVVITAASPTLIHDYLAMRNIVLPHNAHIVYDGEWDAYFQELVTSQPKVYYCRDQKILKTEIVYPKTAEAVLEKFFN